MVYEGLLLRGGEGKGRDRGNGEKKGRRRGGNKRSRPLTKISASAHDDHPTQDSAADITLTHGHGQSVPGKRATSFTPDVPRISGLAYTIE